MVTVRVVTQIEGPIELCFDAARDIDLHTRSLAHTGESAVAGRTTGLIELGETVTWRGRHFGVTQELTSEISAFDRPRHFQDRMVKGAFASFVHDHDFETTSGGTRMTDTVRFSAPLGVLGKLAEVLFLRRHVENLLAQRGETIKLAVETGAPAKPDESARRPAVASQATP